MSLQLIIGILVFAVGAGVDGLCDLRVLTDSCALGFGGRWALRFSNMGGGAGRWRISSCLCSSDASCVH